MKPVHWFLLGMIAVFNLRCEIFLDDPPDCAKGLRNGFNAGCQVYDSNGNPHALDAALMQMVCIDWKTAAEQTRCEELYYDWIACMVGVSPTECNDCYLAESAFGACYDNSPFNPDNSYDGSTDSY